jgi:trigger factor
VERDAHPGDRLNIDFVGRLDGKEFDGGKANGFQLTLGSGTLIEDMEQGLVGAKTGDMRHIPARFPADYRHSMLAGQTADFDVKVNEIAEAELPELNEDFARNLGVADGSLDKLRSDVRANLEREAAGRARAVVRARALKLLLDANPIEVPQSLLDAEAQRLKNSDMASGVNAKDDAAYGARARSRVALGLILGEFIRNRGLTPEPARVRAKLEEMAADYESPQEFIQWHYEKPERLSEIEGLVMEEKVVEDLLVSADISDKPVSFQELLKIETVVQ